MILSSTTSPVQTFSARSHQAGSETNRPASSFSSSWP
jgi:hypothetical protein